MIDVSIDTASALAGLDAGLAQVHATLLSVAEVYESRLVALAVSKADDDVLRVVTGNYIASIHGTIETDAGRVSVHVSSDAPGAGLLEYGGTIPAHDIEPVAGEALRFLGLGVGEVYAAVVHVPDIEVRPHPVIHAAFDELEDEIEDNLVGTVTGAWI